MSWSYQKLGDAAITVGVTVAIIWCLILWLQRVRETKELALRVLITAIFAAIMLITAIPALKNGGYSAIGGLLFMVAFGWILAIIWVPAITGVVGRMFGNLYDGGGPGG